MQYHPERIEKKWQQYWAQNKTFRAKDPKELVTADSPSPGGGQGEARPPFYVLDMFPYPSGAGLHVGHPLGYIASDIYARYKRLKGFNVLHPMGYDSFGLPAEQYAIQTGTHPAITTVANINTFRRQMDNIGFSFDWDREVRTSDPSYYKWTQWIFLQLFDACYCKNADKAIPISQLVEEFKTKGNADVNAHCDETPSFSANEWNSWNDAKQQTVLLNYRIAYLSEAYVNWCPKLGTVLANDEVKDGVSERGGHPVERKLMKQWSMRISAYSQRLLDGLDDIDWSESLKEQQRNWIGRSVGAMVRFGLAPGPSPKERGDSPGYVTADPMLYRLLKDKVQEMKNNPTQAENALWQLLKGDKTGFHFRRQHIVDKYIPDFVCLKKKLIVEVDGKIHDYTQDDDAMRTARLEELGYEVIRFKNEEVLGDTDRVLNQITSALTARSDVSNSLPLGEGQGEVIEVFTTRPDTIFGVSFMTLAPEHELVAKITTAEQKAAIEAYIAKAKTRSDRERMADVKTVSGAFTGAYAEHPFTGAPIPIWIGDYVLAGYGTGAVMAVPSGDQRDYDFAKHFNIPIIPVIEKPANSLPSGEGQGGAVYDGKDGTLINSDFLNGMTVKDGIKAAIAKMEEMKIGEGKINYRQRDAVFGRQRYWGEPIPIYYKNGIPYPVKEEHLPIELPEVDEYLPTETGEPPLARAEGWGYDPERGAVRTSSKSENALPNSLPSGEGQGGVVYPFELSTMPGWAGSSWYYLRYMDPNNDETFCSKEAMEYWGNVNYYAGGAEHATGHLLYVRFWTKFLKDLGHLPFDEPAKKLVNQGMIQGRSNFVYRLDYQVDLTGSHDKKDPTYHEIIDDMAFYTYENSPKIYFPVEARNEFAHQQISSKDLIEAAVRSAPELEMVWNEHGTEVILESVSLTEIHVDVNFVDNDLLNIESFRKWLPEYSKAVFAENATEIKCGWEIEKMSKSKYNVQNPDDIIERYGADTLRLYEMFLGPLEDAKPWNTNGIEGVSRFLKKFWNMFHDGDTFVVSEEAPTPKELKALHATIKKVQEDIERLSFNTSVSQFMICVNELNDLKCNKRAILEPLTVVISTYAPHIAEEIWSLFGHTESITFATYPAFNESFLVKDSVFYPISFNGKTRLTLELPASMGKDEVEQAVLANEEVQQRLEGAAPKKVIVVPGRIVNIVV